MANQFTLKNGGYEPFIGNFGLVPQPPIPEPAAEDNGKVLGVSDGSYALVNGGGGGGTVEPMIVNNEIPSGGLNYALDKTYDEITSHIANGGQVIVKTVTGTDGDSQESYDYIVNYTMAQHVVEDVTYRMYEVATKDSVWGSETSDGVLAQPN